MTGSPPPADAPAQPAILVAGGYPFMRERLRAWLAHEFPGCRTLVAAGPDELCALAATERFSVALVDMDLPGLRGVEMLQLLRMLAPDAAPVALSVYHAEGFREHAVQAGAAACLSPQVLNGALRSVVDALLCAATRAGAP